MKPDEKQKFFVMLSDVMSYYKQDTSAFMLNVFWDACHAVDYEVVVKAINAHVKDPDKGQFAPKVADLVRLLVGTKSDRSALAWGKAYRAMCEIGAYQDVCFDDPAIHAAINDCGGWVKLCRSELDDISYLQHRFGQSYQAYSGMAEYEYPKVLTGDRSPDSMFLKRGLQPPAPVYVGDQGKAKQTFLLGGPTKERELTENERMFASAL